MQENELLQSTADWTGPPSSGGREPIKETRPLDSNHNTLASGINGYLLSMNLETLSERERESVTGNNSDSRHLLMDRPMDETADSHGQDHDKTGGQPQPFNAQGSWGRPRSIWVEVFDLTDPFAYLSLAANIAQLMGKAAHLAFNITHVYHHKARDPPRELQILSKKLMQYYGLLQPATKVVYTSVPTGELQELGLEVLTDSKRTMDEVEKLLHKFHRLFRVLRVLQWRWTKRDIGVIVEELESLKSTLTIMLPLHQVQKTETRFGGTEVEKVLPGHSKDTGLQRMYHLSDHRASLQGIVPEVRAKGEHAWGNGCVRMHDSYS